MNEHDDVICLVRDGLSGVDMDTAVDEIFARGRVRRRRQLSGLTAAATAAGAATVMTLTIGGPATVPSAHPSPAAGRGSAGLAAFTVTSGPGDSTTLTMRKGIQYRLNPSALRKALAEHGIPALVTVGKICSTQPGKSPELQQIARRQKLADGSVLIIIDGSKVPAGSRLSIGYFQELTLMSLVKDGSPLNCTSNPPAVALGNGTR